MHRPTRVPWVAALLVVASLATADEPAPPPDPFLHRGRYEASLLLRALAGVRDRGPALAFAAATVPGGRLVARSPAPALLLSGTPAEIGRAHGTLLKSEIAILHEHYLLAFLKKPEELARAREVATELEPFISPRHREELAAMAEAAGLPLADALLAQTFLDAYKVALCSTAAVDARRSSTGEPLVARNLDFPTLGIAHRATVLAVVRPAGRFAFASVGWPGMTGALTGINEHGLTLAVMVLHEGTPYRAGMPYTLVFRTILEEAKTTDEALELLRKAPRTTGNNLILCDRAGSIAVAEITVEDVRVHRGTNGLVYSTNHCQRPAGAGPAHPSLTYPSSFARYCAMARLLDGHERIGHEELRRALSETAMRLTNIHSMVIAPRSAKLWLSCGAMPAADGPFHEIDLAPWLAGEGPAPR